jgi:sugar phosphate isomerase/epimerase
MDDLEIGVMLNNLERDRLKAFAMAGSYGFRVVHTSALPEGWLTGPERDRYVAAARASGVSIHTMFVGFDGQSYANLPAIRRTVGLVIPELREHRTRIALLYSDLARELGVGALGAHVGFMPRDRAGSDYAALVRALHVILDRCAEHGQTFQLETGQEPAAQLQAFLQDVDRPNLGVNFDPANMILYGTGEPLGALDRLAPHVRGVHCKDALPSGDPAALGTEVPLGRGVVDFRALLKKLHAIGYQGPLVIEREHGPRVFEDVEAARAYLGGLVREIASAG